MDTVDVQLHGGPLDGQTVPVLAEDEDPWTAILSDHGQYPGGRSLYAPDAEGVWRWVRDTHPEEL
ncbi:hypothetical protein ACFYPN_32445 [Streptomyces sp. NPDC005576]|uniref:hypothetical protein n=1 Tax=Streptomyces sp. NPDC005576 TaxID=3364726 RepID=UPI0036BCE248